MMRRRVLVGVGALVVVVAVIGSCSRSASDEAEPLPAVQETVITEEEPAADEEPAVEEAAEAPADDAAAERAAAEDLWRVAIADWGDQLGNTLGELGDMLQDPATGALILLGDEETTIRIGGQLAALMSCGRTLRQEVGPPPTQRMRKAYRLIRRACGKFNLSAQRIATGLDNRDVATLQDAMVSMEAGRALVVRATDAIPAG